MHKISPDENVQRQVEKEKGALLCFKTDEEYKS
jgi:hypothetical protein